MKKRTTGNVTRRRYVCKPSQLAAATPPALTAAADGGESGGETSGEGYSIDVILKTTASEYWGYVEAGAKAYMTDNPDVNVEVKGASSETAYDAQQKHDRDRPELRRVRRFCYRSAAG